MSIEKIKSELGSLFIFLRFYSFKNERFRDYFAVTNFWGDNMNF